MSDYNEDDYVSLSFPIEIVVKRNDLDIAAILGKLLTHEVTSSYECRYGHDDGDIKFQFPVANRTKEGILVIDFPAIAYEGLHTNQQGGVAYRKKHVSNNAIRLFIAKISETESIITPHIERGWEYRASKDYCKLLINISELFPDTKRYLSPYIRVSHEKEIPSIVSNTGSSRFSPIKKRLDITQQQSDRLIDEALENFNERMRMSCRSQLFKHIKHNSQTESNTKRIEYENASFLLIRFTREPEKGYLFTQNDIPRVWITTRPAGNGCMMESQARQDTRLCEYIHKVLHDECGIAFSENLERAIELQSCGWGINDQNSFFENKESIASKGWKITDLSTASSPPPQPTQPPPVKPAEDKLTALPIKPDDLQPMPPQSLPTKPDTYEANKELLRLEAEHSSDQTPRRRLKLLEMHERQPDSIEAAKYEVILGVLAQDGIQATKDQLKRDLTYLKNNFEISRR